MAREGRLFSNTLLLGASAAACKLLSLLLLPLYTDALTPAEFGVVEIFVTTAVLLIPLVTLYAPQAMFRFCTQGELGAAYAGGFLLLSGIAFLLFLIPIAAFFNVSSAYRWFLFFYIFASAMRTWAAQLLRARGAFGLFSLQQCFCTVLTVLLQILFLLENVQIWKTLIVKILKQLLKEVGIKIQKNV